MEAKYQYGDIIKIKYQYQRTPVRSVVCDRPAPVHGGGFRYEVIDLDRKNGHGWDYPRGRCYEDQIVESAGRLSEPEMDEIWQARYAQRGAMAIQ